MAELTSAQQHLLSAQTIDGGQPRSLFRTPISTWKMFFQHLPVQGLRIASNKREAEDIVHVPGLLTVAMLELFGFVTIQHGKPESGKGWRIIKISRLRWGDALLARLSETLGRDEPLIRLHSEVEMPSVTLQAMIQPYFPAWHNNLRLPQHVFKDGTYIFNIALGRAWRRIAVQGRHKLDKLSDGILDAFEFDDDHLYEFSYENRFGTLTKINHPMMETPPLTSEFRIGDIPLRLGDYMTYLYDFGHRWQFDVRLERIDPADRRVRKASLVEAHGEAPEQYPYDADRDEWYELET